MIFPVKAPATPLVRACLLEFEVIGLRPYPGLARLFKSGIL
jgi:hypothetical protein